jgi:hypothetical protein
VKNVNLEDFKKALRTIANEVTDQDLQYLLHDGTLTFTTFEAPIFKIDLKLVELK